MKSIINITNGSYLNSYLQNKYPNETFIPFNEAMIEGNPILPIFSDDFINERCQTHQVSKESYFENIEDFLTFSKNITSYESIVLWFGKDMFCQVNLLTVLAYLHQENYHNPIYLNLIDEETYEIIEQISIPKINYLDIYHKFFIEQQMIHCQLTDLNQAMYDFFNYTNELIAFIKENNHLSNDDLEIILIEKTKKYGLGDTQIHKMIQKYKIN